jgi:hypothetical protein
VSPDNDHPLTIRVGGLHFDERSLLALNTAWQLTADAICGSATIQRALPW